MAHACARHGFLHILWTAAESTRRGDATSTWEIEWPLASSSFAAVGRVRIRIGVYARASIAINAIIWCGARALPRTNMDREVSCPSRWTQNRHRHTHYSVRFNICAIYSLLCLLFNVRIVTTRCVEAPLFWNCTPESYVQNKTPANNVTSTITTYDRCVCELWFHFVFTKLVTSTIRGGGEARRHIDKWWGARYRSESACM